MVIKVVGAFVAIAAFAILLETPKRYLKYAGIVGAIGWFIYLLSQELGMTDVFATFLSAMAISIVSHLPLQSLTLKLFFYRRRRNYRLKANRSNLRTCLLTI